MPQKVGRRRPPTGRQEEISRQGRAARQGQGNPAPRVAPGTPRGFGGPRQPQPGQGNGRARQPGGGGAPGVGPQALSGPGGAQLARRVASGAISQEQADRTMKERQTLKKAFGPNWRDKAFGGTGKVQQARQQLAANPNDPKLLALNRRLMEQRQAAVTAARNGGGEGAQPQPGAPKGQPQGQPRPQGQPTPRKRRRRQPAPAGY